MLTAIVLVSTIWERVLTKVQCLTQGLSFQGVELRFYLIQPTLTLCTPEMKSMKQRVKLSLSCRSTELQWTRKPICSGQSRDNERILILHKEVRNRPQGIDYMNSFTRIQVEPGTVKPCLSSECLEVALDPRALYLYLSWRDRLSLCWDIPVTWLFF